MRSPKIGSAVAVATAVWGLAACGGSSDSPAATSPGTYAVTVGDFVVKPAATKVKSGKVTFTVKNDGGFEHELVVMRASATDFTLKADGEADEASIPEADHMGEVEHLKPGASGTFSTTLTPGHYVMFCNLSAKEGVHFKQGMHAEFDVS